MTEEKKSDDQTPETEAALNRPRKRSFILPLATVLMMALGAAATILAYQAMMGQQDSVMKIEQSTLSHFKTSVENIELRLAAIDQLSQQVHDLNQLSTDLVSQHENENLQVIQRVDQLKKRISETQQQVSQRISILEDSFEDRLIKLQRQANDATQRLSQARKNESSDIPATPHVIGVEYRGLPFLRIASDQKPLTLNRTRLLGERESLGPWQLLNISTERDQAEFRYCDPRHHVTVPLSEESHHNVKQ